MKNFKKIITIILAGIMLISMAGCTAKSKADIMKENAAIVDGEEIKKEQLDKFVGFTLVSYYANQQVEVPSADDSIKDLRRNILDNLIQEKLSKYASDKYPVKVDEKEIDKETKASIKTIKEAIGDEAKYKRILEVYGFGASNGGTGTSKNNKSLSGDEVENTDKNSEELTVEVVTPEKDFETTVREFVTLSYKLNSFEDSFKKKEKGSKEYTEAPFTEVGGKEIPSYVYYYYMIQKEFEISSSGQTISTQEQIDEINKQAMESAEICQVYINEGEKEGFEATEKEIKLKLENFDMLEGYFGKDTIEMLCDAYGITYSQYKKAKEWVATGDVYMEKVLVKNVDAVKVSESDAKREFEKNKASYETGTVSAKHILTTDKALADEILKKAKSTGNGFDAVMNEYQNNKAVTEASDLGQFSKGQMVKEFENAAFGAEEGEIVGPVKTEYGYHVIYVYQVSKGEEPEFENYKEALMQQIRAEKQAEIENKYTQLLKSKAGIKKLRDMKNPFDMLIDSLKEEHTVKINEKVIDK